MMKLWLHPLRMWLMLVIVLLLFACSSQPFPRAVIVNDRMPLYAAPFNHAASHKTGCIYTVLGLVSWGDASITAAQEYRELQVGDHIPRMGVVSHIDMERNTVLGTGCVKTVAHGLFP